MPESQVWQERKNVATSPLAEIFRGPLLKRTILASLLTATVLFAYWGLFTWLPGFLAMPYDKGGAGMTIVKTSSWIIPLQIGAFCGYISFGFIADRLGRRVAFIIYLAISAMLVPIYGHMAHNEFILLAMGPLVGFFGSGYFSLFGAYLSELYPTSTRATGQGFTYNSGRAISALAPYVIGQLARSHGIGSALALTSAFFIAGALLILPLPEKKGEIFS